MMQHNALLLVDVTHRGKIFDSRAPLTLKLLQHGHLHLQHLFWLLSRLHLQGDCRLAQLIHHLVDLPEPPSPDLPRLKSRRSFVGEGRAASAKKQILSAQAIRVLLFVLFWAKLTTFHRSLTTSATDRMSVGSPVPLIPSALSYSLQLASVTQAPPCNNTWTASSQIKA